MQKQQSKNRETLTTVNFRVMSQAKPIKCINFFAIELQYYSNGFIDRNDKPNTLISDR